MATYSSRESHGWRNLVGHGPWGRRESDMTEVTKQARIALRFKTVWTMMVKHYLKAALCL